MDWLFFWTGFSIALMTKGAASVVLLIAAVLFAMTERWEKRRFGAKFWLGMLLFALLVTPWHLYMYRRFGNAFIDEYLGLHVLARATQQIEGHRTQWWFYLKVLLVSAPPFCLLYPVAVWRGFRRRELRVWAIFAVVVVVFFTVIQTRLPHYIAPAYPALTVLAAVWVGDWIRSHMAESGAFWIRAAGVTVTIWFASVLLTHSALKNLHSARLGAGTTLADNKEAGALLRKAYPELPPVDGPLLLC